MSKLLNNLPIEDLTPENDYLGIIEKGDLIKTFLVSNTDEFKDIKMFTLYGEWGSGKSTLMKYLQKQLKGSFNTYFFEAWEFESDSNLSISLLEFLMKKSTSVSEELVGKILTSGKRLLKGLVSSSKLKASLKFIEFELDGEKMVQSLEQEKEKSFIELKEEFKMEFRRWEDDVTKGKSLKYNIVFVDDLDRCEPENVLNLLSALKLFFTYGQKTIFFCGIDEKAINEAVKTKYGDVVKSSEYLEKVFDISFKMPLTANKLKLFSQYFSSKTLYHFKKSDMPLPQIIDIFFDELNFTNPRRIKKVLNRFLIVKNIIGNLDKGNHLNEHYGKITNDDEICLFDLFFTLYFIILKLFYSEKLEDIENDILRSLNYELAIANQKGSNEADVKSYMSKLRPTLTKSSIRFSQKTIKNLYKSQNSNFDTTQGYDFFSKFLIKIAPINPDIISNDSFFKVDLFKLNFKISEKKVDYYFVLFLLNNYPSIFVQEIDSEKMVSEILYFIKSIP